MEINRKLLRKNAWNALKGIYWFMFLACLVASLIGVIDGGGLSLSLPTNRVETTYTARDIPDLARFGANLPEITEGFAGELGIDRATLAVAGLILLGVILVLWLLAILFAIFVAGPARVSFAKLKIAAVVDREKDSGYAFYGFKNNYLSNVKIMFLRWLYIFLWQLPIAILFIAILVFTFILYYGPNDAPIDALFGLVGLMLIAVIGLAVVSIWKRYQYLLVPYIAAENPGIGAKEAIRLSSKMMRGFKAQAFVLRLSFIGWYILGALPYGIGVLFVEPYYQATETLLYEELKAHYNGTVLEAEVVLEINE